MQGGDGSGESVTANNPTEDIPANNTPCPYVVLLLAQRLRRWANIKTTMGQYIVLLGSPRWVIAANVGNFQSTLGQCVQVVADNISDNTMH